MKQQKSYLGLLFLILCLICVSNNAFAQAKNTISGKVLDEEGHTIPGANVSLQVSDKNVITDENGVFIFSDVPKSNVIVFLIFIFNN